MSDSDTKLGDRPTLLAEDIEITPEMLAAGIEEYALFDVFDTLEWLLPSIYRAMELARRNQAEQPPKAAPPPCGTP